VRIRTDGSLVSALTLDEGVVAFERPTWSPTRPGTATVTYRVENTGNTILRGPLTVQLDTAFDRKVPVVFRDEVVLLPDAVIEGTASTAAWPTLTFRPEVRIDVPTVDSRGRESTLVVSDIGEPLTAVPWAQLLAVALVLVGVLAAWVVARAVARRLSGGVTPGDSPLEVIR